ncbi:hypothetical protein [Methylobacterium oryzisoli]|uniref:hypothetical protein n=1 Tax=Methylobacterium oryzisoli TaxID=3385502 RepID=UPI0038916724
MGGSVDRQAVLRPIEDRTAMRRVSRELGRLEALAARRRMRVRILRGLRGGAGAAGTFALLLKLKLAGSLALKLGLALAAGLVFAWPVLGIVVLVVLGTVVWIASLFDGDGGRPSLDGPWDLSCDCDRREKRAARLAMLIERRRSWLAAPSGPPPSPRAEAEGSRRTR